MSTSTSRPLNSSSQANEEGEEEGECHGGEVGEEIIKLTKGKAPCWDHFERVSINGVVKGICNYCSKRISASAKNGTKALNCHYTRCRQRLVDDTTQKISTQRNMFDKNSARREHASMIIMHEYPLSIVEHVGFRRYSFVLQPLFEMISRNTVKADIIKIFDDERSKAIKVVERNLSRVAVTTDMWTSSNQRRGFMVITGHYIDDCWRLQSIILRFVYVPCPHTAEVLCESLMKTLLDWNIDRKLSTLTLDNCTTNDAMFPILQRKLDIKSLMANGSLIHMQCAAHILNLIVKDGLDVIKEGIEKIRESVVYWTAGTKREETFFENVRQMNIQSGKKLILDCVTRWNSTYKMITVAMGYKDVFPRLALRDKQYKSCPKNEDWDLAEEVCRRLRPFNSCTECFSGTKYPTSNQFFYKVCSIKIELSQWAESCENNHLEEESVNDRKKREMLMEMGLQMIDKYDKYWAIIHGILGVTAVLDPRFKMTMVEYYFGRIYGEDSFLETERIRYYCNELFNEYKVKLNQGGVVSPCIADSTIGGQDDLADFDRYASNKKKRKTSSRKSELELYLEEDLEERGPDFDLLVWWKSTSRFPIMKAIARDVLAIPVSSVPSESAFSTSGRVVTPHRSRLHPQTLEALMCARSWLWTLEHEGDPSNGFDEMDECDEIVDA